LLQIDSSNQIPVQHQSTGRRVIFPLAQLYFPQLPTPGREFGERIEPVGQFDLASIPGTFILQLPTSAMACDKWRFFIMPAAFRSSSTIPDLVLVNEVPA
jgi:hypothetical protein